MGRRERRGSRNHRRKSTVEHYQVTPHQPLSCLSHPDTTVVSSRKARKGKSQPSFKRYSGPCHSNGYSPEESSREKVKEEGKRKKIDFLRDSPVISKGKQQHKQKTHKQQHFIIFLFYIYRCLFLNILATVLHSSYLLFNFTNHYY